MRAVRLTPHQSLRDSFPSMGSQKRGVGPGRTSNRGRFVKRPYGGDAVICIVGATLAVARRMRARNRGRFVKRPYDRKQTIRFVGEGLAPLACGEGEPQSIPVTVVCLP